MNARIDTLRTDRHIAASQRANVHRAFVHYACLLM